MTTLVSDIIKYALRQGNLIAIGASPSDAQNTEGLFYINNIVSSVTGNEVSDPLTSFPVGAENISRPAGYPWWNTTPGMDWFVPKNTRIMLNIEQPVDLYLHPDPDDGTRFAVIDVAGTLDTYPVVVYGNGRLIENATSLTLTTDHVDTEWLYRADTGNWQKYTPLTLTDTMPFPSDFDDFFITTLATKLNPAYGVEIDAQSAASMQKARSQLSSRYAQVVPQRSELGLIRAPKVAADRDRWGSSYVYYDPNSLFDKGWPW